MAMIKSKDIEKMNEKERQEKIKELKLELIKTKVSSSKTGKLNPKVIKRTIAKLLTFSRLNKGPKKTLKKSVEK